MMALENSGYFCCLIGFFVYRAVIVWFNSGTILIVMPIFLCDSVFL